MFKVNIMFSSNITHKCITLLKNLFTYKDCEPYPLSYHGGRINKKKKTEQSQHLIGQKELFINRCLTSSL